MKFVKKAQTSLDVLDLMFVLFFFTNFMDIIDLFYASYFPLTTKNIGF